MPLEANRPVDDGSPPQGLAEATPSAQRCAPYPYETHRGNLSAQTSRAARAVLAPPFGVDALKIPRLYGGCLAYLFKVDWSRALNYFHVNSGTVAIINPGKSTPRPGPEKGAPATLETCWDQSWQKRENPNCLSADISSASAHATANFAAFDATREYCTQDCALSGIAFSCLLQRRPSRFAVKIPILFLRRTTFRRRNESPHRRPPNIETYYACARSHPTQAIRTKIPQFRYRLWGHERRNIALVGSYA